MKWRYSVQFVNDDGNTQEEDVFDVATEALKCRENLASNGKSQSKVVDLEDGVEIV